MTITKQIEERIAEFEKFKSRINIKFQKRLNIIEDRIQLDKNLVHMCNEYYKNVNEDSEIMQLSYDTISRDSTESDYYIIGFYFVLTKELKIKVYKQPLDGSDLEKSNLDEAMSYATLKDLKNISNCVIKDIEDNLIDIIKCPYMSVS